MEISRESRPTTPPCPSSTQSLPACCNSGCRRHIIVVEFYSAPPRNLQAEAAMLDDAIRVYRRIFDAAQAGDDAGADRPRAIYVQKQAWTTASTSASSTAPGPYEEAGHPPRWGACFRTSSATCRGPCLEARPRNSRRRQRGAQRARGRASTSVPAVGAAAERHMGRVMDDQEQVAVLLRRARLFSRRLRPRRLGARGLLPRPRCRLRQLRGPLRHRRNLPPDETRPSG